jgi:uroporphyrinogen-III synthase
MGGKSAGISEGRPLAIVTRPRDEACALASELESRGYAVIVEPMLDIHPRPHVLPRLDGFSGLAFTSANGARMFAALSDERGMPAFAVGSATAAALRALGFADIREAGGDAESLAKLVKATVRPGASVLHASGVAVARDLDVLLAPSGISVHRAALYEARPVSSLSDALSQALYACTVRRVLLFSPRTAEVFETMLSENGLIVGAECAAAVCLSSAVSARLNLRWGEVVVASRPTLAAMLESLPTLPGVE